MARKRQTTNDDSASPKLPKGVYRCGKCYYECHHGELVRRHFVCDCGGRLEFFTIRNFLKPRPAATDGSPVVWLVGQVRLQPGDVPDGLTPVPWSFQGVFATEAEAVAVCRDRFWFVGPATVGDCLPAEDVLWDGAYYPIRD